ncbi:hypothetical protein C8Q77DRAFT_1209171, partial [Trametes polyzona]
MPFPGYSFVSANLADTMLPTGNIEALLSSARGFLGTILLATVFTTMFYGLSVNQAYRYYRMYPKDVPLLRGMVAILFVVDTVHTAFAIDASYYYLVNSFLNPLALEIYHISFKIIIPLTGVTALICQSCVATPFSFRHSRIGPYAVGCVLQVLRTSGVSCGGRSLVDPRAC